MEPSVRARWLAAGLLLWGCGGQDRDREDELGLDEAGGRRETVLVDRNRTDAEPGPVLPDAARPHAVSPLPDSGGVPPAVEQASAGDTGAGPDEPVVFAPQGEYTVQIGVYQDSPNAARMVRQLSAEGYPAYAVTQANRSGVRVRIGYFRTRSDAQRFGEIFTRDKGLGYWIDRRSNEHF